MNLLHLGIHDLANAASLGLGTAEPEGPARRRAAASGDRSGAVSRAPRRESSAPDPMAREQRRLSASDSLRRAIAALAQAATLRAAAGPPPGPRHRRRAPAMAPWARGGSRD
jgi:hypothetical protein